MDQLGFAKSILVGLRYGVVNGRQAVYRLPRPLPRLEELLPEDEPRLELPDETDDPLLELPDDTDDPLLELEPDDRAGADGRA